MRPIGEEVCVICGERLFSPYAFESAGAEARCGMCLRVAPIFTRAVAYGSYEASLRDLIHLLKFEGVRPAAAILGRMLAEAISKLETALPLNEVVTVPVPLHRRKRRLRGFNQAELVARAALKNLAQPQRFRLSARVLERKRETTSQVGLTSHQRRINLRGAFVVAEPQNVKAKDVLLIDDVYTTGATVSECARVLLRAGASKVLVATVARTLKVSAQHLEISSAEGETDEILPAETSLAKAVGM
jgi:ComF family protein